MANPSAHDKADTEKHIAACQSYLAGQAAVAQPPTPAEAAKATTPIAAPVAIQPAPAPPMVFSASQSIPARDSGSGLRTAGVIAASVGGAALLAGVELNLKVNSMTSDLEQPNSYNRGTDSTRKDYKTMGWIGCTNGICTAVKSQDDPTGCTGTCDAIGACKAKKGQTCQSVAGGCLTGTTCSPDGICCDKDCTGSCEACDIATALGLARTARWSLGPTTTATTIPGTSGSCGLVAPPVRF